MTTEQRFWSKVKKTDSCWLWTASKRNKGYGAFSYSKDGIVIQDRAHRYSWTIHKGKIPEGMKVLHNCPGGDNPACVNPDHLFLGTISDNNADMVSKGRHVPGGTHCGVNNKYKRGESHHAARIDSVIVNAIRSDRKSGMSFSKLSKKYVMAIGHVFRIVSGKAWAHVK